MKPGFSDEFFKVYGKKQKQRAGKLILSPTVVLLLIFPDGRIF